MSIWALADLHLSFGVPNKQMDVFGPQWKNHPEKIKHHWLERIQAEDLVLLAGDFSWASSPEEVIPDFQWVDALPGTKVLIKGNHDYWWQSLSKVKPVLPASCHLIHNDAFQWQEFAICGARLWDTYDYDFNEYIHFTKPLKESVIESPSDREKVFVRELQRLEMSLKAASPQAQKRIAMTHYPPISADLEDSRASKLLEKYHVDCCVFGHLHSLKPNTSLFGEKNGVRYFLTACDFLDFTPLKLF